LLFFGNNVSATRFGITLPYMTCLDCFKLFVATLRRIYTATLPTVLNAFNKHWKTKLCVKANCDHATTHVELHIIAAS